MSISQIVFVSFLDTLKTKIENHPFQLLISMNYPTKVVLESNNIKSLFFHNFQRFTNWNHYHYYINDLIEKENAQVQFPYLEDFRNLIINEELKDFYYEDTFGLVLKAHSSQEIQILFDFDCPINLVYLRTLRKLCKQLKISLVERLQ